ncbi:ATP-binding protein [Granulosicoccus antarcticus]|uniref:histidine kinase n=1 Tax=Granulosicoccus antarcticus IMCC3135 TaxID=1192854 RepID=A0A2Z2P1C5_9GAMM|nr:ATP-binding protein [Granulosicoccus antarcticus]ASJ75020.1 Sensor protein PhoQ [Granulosicoccus antarcticus IMCC3135]
MQSITSRLVIGTSLVLTVFVVLTALSVSYSVHQRAETARFDRLQGLVYGILGATEISDNARLTVNSSALPDPRLNQATSGLYAELMSIDGKRLWQSTSTASWVPDFVSRPIGDWMFENVERRGYPPLHRLQLATAWELDNGTELPFTVHVVDEADNLTSQLKRFDQTLWVSLMISAVALLIVQLLVLRQSLKPLRNIAEELEQIERGERDALSESVPRELSAMTSGLNTLLRTERERHAQYRHMLDDLAHSLKTPLTVLRNLLKPSLADSDTIQDQTRLMQTSIERHVQRANLRSPRYLAPAIPLRPVIERMAGSLNKLYDASTVSFVIKVDAYFLVRMDEADLFEIFGNILENACKYGAHNILIAGTAESRCLSIDDDGPGFPDMDLQQLVRRGVRADSQTPGTGMGLAAAAQLMANHGGRLEPGHSANGGARIELWFV